MQDARPTILQIIPQLDTGGAELSAIEITEAVVRAGGRALVATEGGRLETRVTGVGGELIKIPVATKNPLRILGNARALQTIVNTENVELIHARSRAPAWSALIAARRSRVPFVTTYHGAYAERGSLKRIYNSVMARADRVIANSGYTADLIRRRYKTPVSRIRIIHRGVDLAKFDPEAIEPARMAALRRAWGAADGQPVILMAARLTGWKGQRVLIEAAGALQREGRLGTALVVLAGDDQGRSGYRQELAALAEAQGVAAATRFVGHVDDIAAAFAAAHVTVVASTEPEAFGRAAVEAQAMACPVIATNIGAPPETVIGAAGTNDDRATGWLIPPKDGVAMAAALHQALSLSAADREQLGRRARAHIAQRFTLEAMKLATLEVYDELLGAMMARSFAAAAPSTVS